MVMTKPKPYRSNRNNQDNVCNVESHCEFLLEDRTINKKYNFEHIQRFKTIHERIFCTNEDIKAYLWKITRFLCQTYIGKLEFPEKKITFQQQLFE